MATEITGLLTKKIGPFPGWAWALVAGGAAFFVLPKLLGGKTTASQTTDTTGAAMTSGYQQGFAQGAQYYPSPQAGSSSAGLTGQQKSDLVASWYQKYLHRAGSASEIQNWVSQIDTRGAGWVEGAIANSPEGQKPGAGSTAGRADGAPPGLPQSGGAGRSASIASRSADAHAYFHPSMKARVRYAHFVRGVGVGGAHEAMVHSTAHSAAIHPARLQALNPVPTGLIRIA